MTKCVLSSLGNQGISPHAINNDFVCSLSLTSNAKPNYNKINQTENEVALLNYHFLQLTQNLG
jgi:hypothetical protein